MISCFYLTLLLVVENYEREIAPSVIRLLCISAFFISFYEEIFFSSIFMILKFCY